MAIRMARALRPNLFRTSTTKSRRSSPEGWYDRFCKAFGKYLAAYDPKERHRI